MELLDTYLSSAKEQVSLRHVRKSLGLSAEFVAGKINISPSTLYRYERCPSNIYPSKANELVKLYGLTVDDVSFK